MRSGSVGSDKKKSHTKPKKRKMCQASQAGTRGAVAELSLLGLDPALGPCSFLRISSPAA